MTDPARQVAEARKYLRSVSQDEQGPLEHGDTIIAALCDEVDVLSARLAQAETTRDQQRKRADDLETRLREYEEALIEIAEWYEPTKPTTATGPSNVARVVLGRESDG